MNFHALSFFCLIPFGSATGRLAIRLHDVGTALLRMPGRGPEPLSMSGAPVVGAAGFEVTKQKAAFVPPMNSRLAPAAPFCDRARVPLLVADFAA